MLDIQTPGGKQSANICARIPSWTSRSRATSASNGETMYIAESNGRNFSEITSAKGRSIVKLEPEPSLLFKFNGAAELLFRES